MMRPLPFLLALLPACIHAQYHEQYFEGTWNTLPYFIDTTAGNLWQVGPPQKVLFNTAYTAPNVIITDTVANYPTSNHSSFTLKAALEPFSWTPVFFLAFYHAFDTDTLQDGGYVEVSWDNGGTWTNVFDDWMMPVNIEIYDAAWFPMQADTLANGQMGFSGRSNHTGGAPGWSFTSVCWTNIGFIEVDTLQFRFNFTSDTIPEEREGWMIDYITLQSGFVHPVADLIRSDDYFLLAPNPMGDRTHIMYDVDEEVNEVFVALYDAQGRIVRVLRDGQRQRGKDQITLWRNELPTADGMYIVRARINGREHQRKLIVHSGGGYLWGAH